MSVLSTLAAGGLAGDIFTTPYTLPKPPIAVAVTILTDESFPTLEAKSLELNRRVLEVTAHNIGVACVYAEAWGILEKIQGKSGITPSDPDRDSTMINNTIVAALPIAAKRGITSTALAILNSGSYLHHHAWDSALREAASCGHTDTLRTFLHIEGGSKYGRMRRVESPRSYLNGINRGLWAAATSGHIKAVEVLLEAGAERSHLFLALTSAIESLNVEVIENLTKCGIDRRDDPAIQAAFDRLPADSKVRVLQAIIAGSRERAFKARLPAILA